METQKENQTREKSSNLYSKLKCITSSLVTPFVNEFPYVVLFMKLMGVVAVLHTFEDLKYQVGIPDAYFYIANRVALLFLFAYVGAVIIAAIKQRMARNVIKAVLYALALMLYATVYFLSQNFQLGISPTCFVLLAETTGKESQEFINQYILSSAIFPTLGKVLVYIFVILVFEFFWKHLLKRMERLQPVVNRALLFVFIPALLYSICSVNIYWKIYNAPSPDHIRFLNPPNDPITSIFSSVMVLDMLEDNMNDAVEKNKMSYLNDSACIVNDDSLNIVVVIGESYVKWHSQLYGYDLETAPCLNEEKNAGRLFVFNDVISSVNYTSAVMRNIFVATTAVRVRHGMIILISLQFLKKQDMTSIIGITKRMWIMVRHIHLL